MYEFPRIDFGYFAAS